MPIVGERDIWVVTVENVLRCNIFNIACALPKNDNRAIPETLRKERVQRELGVTYFWEFRPKRRTSNWVQGNYSHLRQGMRGVISAVPFNPQLGRKHGIAHGP